MNRNRLKLAALLGIVGLAAIVAYTRLSSPDDHGASQVSHWYSKQEFEQDELNKTKAEIKAEWGPPDQVHDDTDSWVYIRLPIRDADAGTPVFMTEIQFDGTGRAQSFGFD